eukprot:COSAG06_NODE_2287_length_7155_cov_20.776927_9_plen_76_part_00
MCGATANVGNKVNLTTRRVSPAGMPRDGLWDATATAPGTAPGTFTRQRHATLSQTCLGVFGATAITDHLQAHRRA